MKKAILLLLATILPMTTWADSEPMPDNWTGPASFETKASMPESMVVKVKNKPASMASFDAPRQSTAPIMGSVYEAPVSTEDPFAYIQDATGANNHNELNAVSMPSQDSLSLAEAPVSQPSINTPYDTTETESTPLPRYFEGTMKVRKSLFNLGHDYRYVLTGSRGNQIAYLDLDDALVSGPIDQFFDQRVIIQGTPQQVENSSAMVIHTRTIRVK